MFVGGVDEHEVGVLAAALVPDLVRDPGRDAAKRTGFEDEYAAGRVNLQFSPDADEEIVRLGMRMSGNAPAGRNAKHAHLQRRLLVEHGLGPAASPRTERDGGHVRCRRERYSTLMFAALMTFAHLGISLLIAAANSSGELPTSSIPRPENLARTSGDASAFTLSV